MEHLPPPPSPNGGAAAHEDLRAALEELRITEEELRAQNEELLTARSEVEAERQRYHDLFEFAPDAYLVTDAHGKILEANRAAAALLNLTQDALPGRMLAGFVPLEERRAFRTRLNLLGGGQPRQVWEMRLCPRHRPPLDVGVTAAAAKSSALRWLLRDVTGQKQAERLAVIGEMVAGLAHESRNALQRSDGCLERLGWRVQDRPDALDLVERIRAAHDDLRRLFEDVRAYAGPGRLEIDYCDLAAVWRDAWAQLGPRRGRRDALLAEDTGGLDLEIVADRFRLRQVFWNIFDNALAACADPVRIDVRCSEARLAGRPALRVAVRDNGPGLNEEQRRKIFEPFYTTKAQGTGLGMAIAKRIVEAHGGELAVSQKNGPGAEILVTLPLRRA